ncbi:MAG: hypothetical protein OXU31_01130 [Gammaproteobacteria bacterium]|nr:hypothetical protein [Gammaproteobacteria bacterium]
MKEDILEQLVEDYFQRRGYFTRHNVKYRPDNPSQRDSGYSDIDILAYHPNKRGVKRVIAVNCKSWQNELSTDYCIKKFEEQGVVYRQDAEWKRFRELMSEKWAESFAGKIKELTGATKFVHYTAVTVLKTRNERETRDMWEKKCRGFTKTMSENSICILTLRQIMDELWSSIGTTMAESEVGRLLQVVKASRWNPPGKK